MIEVISIVLGVVGLLQIILFFKVWAMTNNVKRMKKRLFEQDYASDACYFYLKGDVGKAEELLKDAFLRESANASLRTSDYGVPNGVSLSSKEDELNEELHRIKHKYIKAFEKMGKPIPECVKYNKNNRFLI